MALEAMKKHGAFSWNELMTTDLAAAKTFYAELLGWEVKEMENGPMSYAIAQSDNTDVAGLMQAPTEPRAIPPMWGGYVTVDDVDARTNKARQLGAKVYVEPRDIPDVGRFSVIVDPQGALFNMITYTQRD